MLDESTYPRWKMSFLLSKTILQVAKNTADHHAGPVTPTTADGAPLVQVLNFASFKRTMRPKHIQATYINTT